MVTKEEWNTLYTNVIPVVGVCVSSVGVALAFLALLRSQSQAIGLGSREPVPVSSDLAVSIPKVHYEDSQLLVEVRNPGEWHEIREFVNPHDAEVQRIYYDVGPDAWALLDWVCHNVSYNPDNGEWWSFPGETVRKALGDCDDSASLTCSLIRNFTQCYEVLGTYRGFGHAWDQLDSEILESTYAYAHPVPDPQNYRPFVMFNDQEVIEMWPGALSQLFALGRHNERLKLNLMANALRRAAW